MNTLKATAAVVAMCGAQTVIGQEADCAELTVKMMVKNRKLVQKTRKWVQKVEKKVEEIFELGVEMHVAGCAEVPVNKTEILANFNRMIDAMYAHEEWDDVMMFKAGGTHPADALSIPLKMDGKCHPADEWSPHDTNQEAWGNATCSLISAEEELLHMDTDPTSSDPAFDKRIVESPGWDPIYGL